MSPTTRTLAAIVALTGAIALGACDFDAAFERYCRGNSQCGQDASVSLDSAPMQDAPEPPKDVAAPPRKDSGEATNIPYPKSCGGGGGGGGGSCPNGWVCHPISEICMQPCNSRDDCPAYHDTCVELLDPGSRTQRVCNCSSATSCRVAGSNYVCNFVDHVCEPLCGHKEDCSGFRPSRTCQEVVGHCLPSSLQCISSLDCRFPNQPRCDPETSRCTSCTSSEDCASRRDGLTECDDLGECRQPFQ